MYWYFLHDNEKKQIYLIHENHRDAGTLMMIFFIPAVPAAYVGCPPPPVDLVEPLLAEDTCMCDIRNEGAGYFFLHKCRRPMQCCQWTWSRLAATRCSGELVPVLEPCNAVQLETSTALLGVGEEVPRPVPKVRR